MADALAEGSPPTLTHAWLVEDDADYRATLQLFLQHTQDFRCDQTFASVAEVLDEVEARRRVRMEEGWPHLVILDINLPVVSGIEGLPALRRALPEAAFVMLTMHEDAAHIFRALEQGASGYMTKGISFDRLLAVLRDVRAGGMSLPPPVARLMRDFFWSRPPASDYDLTDREREVLQAMVDGSSQKEIASRLRISATTVNTHLRSLYRKLHVHSGTAAVAKALRERLLPGDIL